MHSLLMAAAESPFTEEQLEKFGALFAGVGLIIFLVALVAGLLIWGMIFSRAGYSFAMALLMFIPLVNFIWLLIFAFSRWPVQKELDGYRRSAQGHNQGYPPPMR